MSIVINFDKAKAIGHDIRRNKRAKELKPYDEIIAKQIPGVDAIEAENARKIIREKYAFVQVAIDKSETLDEIKSALNV